MFFRPRAERLAAGLTRHGRMERREIIMVRSRQQTARKPATKYANLRKKMQKQKTLAKKQTGRKK